MKKETRGGKREGAGQKPVPKAPAIEVPKSSGLSAQELAKQHLDLAIATLSHIAAVGVTETARVAAAKAIVEIAKDDASEPLGKKQERQENAERSASEGRYAAPAPPKLLLTH